MRPFLSIYRGSFKLFAYLRLERFYPLKIIARTVDRFLSSHFESNFAIVQGHKMFLDSKDQLRLSVYGTYEPFETRLLKKHIKSGDVVIDIGAFIGYYTLIFAKALVRRGKFLLLNQIRQILRY